MPIHIHVLVGLAQSDDYFGGLATGNAKVIRWHMFRKIWRSRWSRCGWMAFRIMVRTMIMIMSLVLRENWLTGKHQFLNGQKPWVSCGFPRKNQSIEPLIMMLVLQECDSFSDVHVFFGGCNGRYIVPLSRLSRLAHWSKRCVGELDTKQIEDFCKI